LSFVPGTKRAVEPCAGDQARGRIGVNASCDLRSQHAGDEDVLLTRSVYMFDEAVHQAPTWEGAPGTAYKVPSAGIARVVLNVECVVERAR